LARIDGLEPYPFVVHPSGADKFISRDIRDKGVWEPFETLLLRRLLPHFRLFLDLGANIGWYTALAQRVMKPAAEIHAFEPDASNFRLLKINARKPSPVKTRLLRMAVSDRSGKASLYRSADNFGDHRLNSPESGRSPLEVRATTLDAYFGARRLPPLVAKIDTQGSEPAILRGASRVLSPELRENVIILEFWPTAIEAAGENIDAFIERLVAFTDTPFRINHEARQLQPASWRHFARRAKTDLHIMKLFFDLLLVRPNSSAMEVIRDLVSPDEEGSTDPPLHF
jgi:FkbM family methyltransferase